MEGPGQSVARDRRRGGGQVREHRGSSVSGVLAVVRHQRAEQTAAEKREGFLEVLLLRTPWVGREDILVRRDVQRAALVRRDAPTGTAAAASSTPASGGHDG